MFMFIILGNEGYTIRQGIHKKCWKYFPLWRTHSLKIANCDKQNRSCKNEALRCHYQEKVLESNTKLNNRSFKAFSNYWIHIGSRNKHPYLEIVLFLVDL